MKNGNGKSITSCGHLLKKNDDFMLYFISNCNNIRTKRWIYGILFLKLQHNLNELWIYFIYYIKLQHKLKNGEFMIHFTWNCNETEKMVNLWYILYEIATQHEKRWIYIILFMKLQWNMNKREFIYFFIKLQQSMKKRWIYATFYKNIATQANCELRMCIPAVHTDNS